MTDSAPSDGPEPGTAARTLDLDRQAGALALEMAQAAGGADRRASRQAILRVLLDAVNAEVVAYYVATSDGTARRVVQAATDSPQARRQLAVTRRVVLDWVQGGLAPARDDAANGARTGLYLAGTTLVLPLGPEGEGRALAITWPSDVETVLPYIALIERIALTVQLAFSPLVATTPTRRRATRQRHLDSPHADLIAELSHDLRTPLNTLGGFLELALEERVGPLNDRQREFLGYARESAMRLASLIEQIHVGGTTDQVAPEAAAGVATKSARPAPSSYGS